MEQILSQVALTSATFVGRAAWSYASGLAMKKITKQIEATTGNSNRLSALEQKLHKKLSVLTPIIDSMELLQAQGRADLQSILECCDDLRTRLKTASVTEPSEDDLVELIELIDDLIPLVNLSLAQNPPRSNSSSISYSRLLLASSALVTGDAIMNYTTPETSIQIAAPFPVRLYSLFEGSNRKNRKSDTTWREDFVKAVATIERGAAHNSRTYQLKIVQNLDDGRFHDEDEVGKTKLIEITDIVKLYYTISGKLLNIEESTLPVLVLKTSCAGETASETKTDTPRPVMKTEWIALELYRDEEESDDDEEVDDSKNITENLKALGIDSAKPSVESGIRSPLDSLCLLEYLIRLCSLEMREFTAHAKVDDRIFNLYFASAEKDPSTNSTISLVPNANLLGKSPAPTPTKRGTLLTRFLSD